MLMNTKARPFKLQADGVRITKSFYSIHRWHRQWSRGWYSCQPLCRWLCSWVQDMSAEICLQKIKSALKNLELWAKKNKMKINEEKCEFILFANWNKEFSLQSDLKINGKQINISLNPVFQRLPLTGTWLTKCASHCDLFLIQLVFIMLCWCWCTDISEHKNTKLLEWNCDFESIVEVQSYAQSFYNSLPNAGLQDHLKQISLSDEVEFDRTKHPHQLWLTVI